MRLKENSSRHNLSMSSCNTKKRLFSLSHYLSLSSPVLFFILYLSLSLLSSSSLRSFALFFSPIFYSCLSLPPLLLSLLSSSFSLSSRIFHTSSISLSLPLYLYIFSILFLLLLLTSTILSRSPSFSLSPSHGFFLNQILLDSCVRCIHTLRCHTTFSRESKQQEKT